MNNIDSIIHERIETFYNLFEILPKIIPVSLEEYHQLEERLKMPCLCLNEIARRKRKLAYCIGENKIVVIVNKSLSQRFKDEGIIIH